MKQLDLYFICKQELKLCAAVLPSLNSSSGSSTAIISPDQTFWKHPAENATFPCQVTITDNAVVHSMGRRCFLSEINYQPQKISTSLFSSFERKKLITSHCGRSISAGPLIPGGSFYFYNFISLLDPRP